jgi:hypothetical protein
MIFHEGRDEVIAVVIAGLATQDQRDARMRTGVLQQFGAKLFGQEWIGIADIDQEIGKPRTILDQRDRVVPAPGRDIRLTP